MAREGEKSLREQQLEERRERMKKLNPQVERVRVTPASDEIRAVLRHPKSMGVKFPKTGSMEWPLDQFTRRRIEDGSVTREGGEGNRDRAVPRYGQQQDANQQPPPDPNDPNAQPQPDPNAQPDPNQPQPQA